MIDIMKKIKKGRGILYWAEKTAKKYSYSGSTPESEKLLEALLKMAGVPLKDK